MHSHLIISWTVKGENKDSPNGLGIYCLCKKTVCWNQVGRNVYLKIFSTSNREGFVSLNCHRCLTWPETRLNKSLWISREVCISKHQSVSAEIYHCFSFPKPKEHFVSSCLPAIFSLFNSAKKDINQDRKIYPNGHSFKDTFLLQI